MVNKRIVKLNRTTKETDIEIELNIDGKGNSNIDTGLKFLDHMLDSFSRHGFFDLNIKANGDIEVDDHHTVEDTALLLGECFKEALGDKKGIERMGFSIVPMDESLAQVAVDISGRSYTVFDAEFKFQKIGDISSENVKHFIESFANTGLMNINIKAEGENDHHICEAIFKSLARSLNSATKITHDQILSTKGKL
ncbi:MAG: imidazoleglycerol-phosphate dehydratase HisB [Methanosphaera sp.]|uniref:imidazoleglycerol-phosphate dehydratase HisB n=1 Tax=Methanosphaera sp. ISO3-F5 TaxID=1452353 RepID=UPI002B25E316|nr:imidazoleglycerol-phosphate dehydratase HisB [Methanosphaera sp. ISO3-F5]MBR0471661.1 imidazoleglycerol-phosphate dehydratase HisB [Methanosphaera sp.]WQH65084.1 imidazoleglycerol-phosphate dehydratase HisB [Methanosphaera sp. ISO3-F5]